MAPLLESAIWRHLLLAMVAIQVTTTFFLGVGLPCPIHELVGGTCPGCGLGNAIDHLAHGEWAAGLAMHAFAPLFVAAVVALIGASVLPATLRSSLAGRVRHWEERTCVTTLLLGALIVYWLVRQH